MKTLFKIVFPLIITSITAYQLKSQDINLKEIYEKNVISEYGNKYMRNGEVLTRKDVNSQLLKFPESATEYNLAKRKFRTGSIIYIASLTSTIGAIFYAEENPELALGLALAGLGGLVIAYPFNLNGWKHYHRSLWLYNRDILLEQY